MLVDQIAEGCFEPMGRLGALTEMACYHGPQEVHDGL